jgi:hypothetical protein
VTKTRKINLDSVRVEGQNIAFQVDVDGQMADCLMSRSRLMGLSPGLKDYFRSTDTLFLRHQDMVQQVVDKTFAKGWPGQGTSRFT